LKQVLPVEGCSCIRGDINCARYVSTRWIEGVQPVSGSKPDLLTVLRDSMHAIGNGEGTIVTHDFCG
jgi:hypothetical protein